MNLVKNETENIFTYAGKVNRDCDKFKLDKLSPDWIKCIIFVKVLVWSNDAETGPRIPRKIEQNSYLTIQTVAE